MIWKKTWFSYCLWAFYSIIVCLFMSLGVMLLVSDMNNRYIMVGIVCLFFLGLTAIYFLIQFFVNKISNNKEIEKRQSNIFEAVIIVIGTIAWVVLYTLTILQLDADSLTQSEYLINSFIERGNVITKASYGAAWIYMYILRTIFFVVGNHAQSALWLQFVLQLSGALLMYRGVRNLSGQIASVWAYLGLLYLPAFVIPVGTVQTFWVAFFAFSIGFYILCSLLHARRKQEEYRKIQMVFGYVEFFLAGLFTAVVVYLDFYGCLLILLGASVLWSLPVREKGQKEVPFRTLQALCFILGIVIVFALLFFGESFYFGVPFVEALADWWRTYSINLGRSFALNFDESKILLFVIIASTLFWGMFCFFKEREEDTFMGNFILLIGMAAFQFIGIGVEESKLIWLFVVMIICGASSLGLCLIPRKIEEVKVEQEKGKEPQEEIVSETPKEEKAKVKLLDNPLPGPKKHVSKVLDYDLKLDRMPRVFQRYDIKVADDDDFDIK